jgi:hypothetical protein
VTDRSSSPDAPDATPGPLAHTLEDATWTKLDRTLWRLERDKVEEALARNPRPYLELRRWRIDRMLRALDVLLGESRGT